ncbi:MAG: ABC transporter permease [Prevotella sp.]|uniref:ABC transporter permease n=1 Tax=Leyella stercorea TaxID=363265 RepID=UPI001F19F295|nr:MULTISPECIES: ABC transporter permease [Prevotellaceae]MCF2579948.1 ABC transporter permease [Leyella stercorea]MCI7183766.1 ABC transporter permease [Prevotella sp.]
MKSLLYMFRRYRLATLLNLLGLGVAVATFYLFMTQVIYNRTYNHNIHNYEHMYRLEIYGNFGDVWGANVCRPFVTILKDIPQIKNVTYISPYVNETDVKVGNRTITVPSINMGKPGIEFFTGKLLSGSSKTCGEGYNVIVNRSTAEKMFGTANAAGKTFEGENGDGSKTTVTVVGVSEDMPDNCTLPNGVYICENESVMNDWSEWSFNVYMLLDDGANPKKVERAIKLAFMKVNGVSEKDEKRFDKEVNMKFRISPMDDIYFSGVGKQDKGNRNLVGVLTVASVFVLFIAMLNLLNFSLSEIPMRMRGINTRRVMGASIGSLRLKMIMENVMFAFVALLIGIVLVIAFQRSETCMKLVSGDIHFSSHMVLAAVMAVSALVVGALSAVVPAFYSTSFTPAMVLKGSFGLSPRGRRLRMAIMAVQFCLAFALTIYIGVMSSQSSYIFNSDYGFNKNEVFYTWLSDEAKAKKDAVRAELKKLPFVESVGFAQNAIGTSDGYMGWGRGDGDHHMVLQVLPCDYEYLRTMQLKIVEGRDFRESDMKTGAYVLNKTAMAQYKWLVVGDSIGRQSNWGSQSNYNIVGVCNNFKLKSMRCDNSNVAVAFVIFGPDMAEWGDRCGQVFVRVAKNQDKIEAKRRIAEVLNRLDGSQKYEMWFLDDDLQQTYVEEFRFISQVKLFAIICIIITIIGVFSLTMFETEYRRKEIAIRKVMGSSIGSVVRLFAMRYALPLVVAFVVAAPVGWWLSNSWLQSFAEHTPIHWWLFPLSFVLVSAVVVITVIIQSWRVATANPVESIKTE